MHFTLPAITLALAAAVSASNPIQAAWNVTRSYKDVSQQVVSFEITAVYVDEEYPDGLESKCTWVEKGQVYGVQCTPDTFTLEPQRDGLTMKVHQTIEKPNQQVVYGEGEVPRSGHAVIPVNARVA
ncbi:hypothetical protein J4E83_007917 [Alternaria metachromatica]|uniref:uncharacterized protein n=1 Tax=Alternaria metachromatica TaxID=283354 RepID=UPI0020C4E808|nr:uncharacterized protein J4E83_007917 [Alternaria metachromatica]XP_049214683.1 uncharacterized protein J4E79_001940 [Alternaria viburni]XP_049221900.1 uncharacterized protein J4E78_005555 [Alternaria triticimaculans]KAI4606229.1 hypothetical protein J4E80_010206 [Alternaria sp. BMP 0032]KAI4710443.1 hypothetical protein J4E89_004898 [Alternaria sp. Ai002NY15]KAI4611667.1 hypothetical protein J4E83_007917 [Alternaria metachromatica]KAI4659131.1 hypothetical protein J4E78_005555 [Alternaria 